MRAQGYAPFGASKEQDVLLDEMTATAGPGKVGVFDLDGCLFDTRHRQIIIFREFASRHEFWELYRVQPEHFSDWDLKTTLLSAGIPEERIDQFLQPLSAYWKECFFSSEYVRFDHAMPGSQYVARQCYEKGMFVVYLTGRDHSMRDGTEMALRSYGFPYDVENTLLITKSDFHIPDAVYKKKALAQIATLGDPVLFVDNEPENVNVFARAHPKAKIVFIETDHSFKPESPKESIPWIRSWYRSEWCDAVMLLPSMQRY